MDCPTYFSMETHHMPAGEVGHVSYMSLKDSRTSHLDSTCFLPSRAPYTAGAASPLLVEQHAMRVDEPQAGPSRSRPLMAHPLRAFLDRRFLGHSAQHVLAIGSFTQRAQLRVGLEEDLQHILQAAQIYKEAIIASAPISRLPPEILSLIFTFLAWIDTPASPRVSTEEADALVNPEAAEPIYVHRHWSGKGSLGWIKCTHICRSWRVMLLGMKDLWAQSVGILPCAISETLERAANFPIRLTLRETLRRRIPFIPLDVFQKEARIKSIYAVFTLSPEDTHVYNDFCHILHAKSHPILESLCVYGNRALYTDSFQQDPSTLIVAPALRTVRFTNFFLFFAPCPLQTLSLVFSEYRDESEPEMPLRVLLKLLRSVSTTLEDLELSECFSRAAVETAEVADIPVVNLSKLRRARLVGRTADMSALLRCLIVPSSCTVHYRLVDKDTDEIDMNVWMFNALCQNLSTVRETLPEGYGAGFRLQHAWDSDDNMDVFSWRGPYFEFWHAPLAYSYTAEKSSPSPGFRLYSPNLNILPLTRTLFDPEGPEQGRIMPEIYALNITHRPSFYLSDFELMWVSRQLPNVRLIVFDAPCVMILLNLLSARRGSPTAGSPKEPGELATMFPRLEAIWMTKGAFQYEPVSCERLVALVRARAAVVASVREGDAQELRYLTVDAGIPFSDPDKKDWAVEQLRGLLDLRWRI